MGVLIKRRDTTVKRYFNGARVNGKWVRGLLTPFVIQATIQPLTPAEMEMLPESRRRAGESYRIFTDTQLLTTRTAENADLIEIGNDDFEVITEEVWENNIINHKTFIILKLTSK